MFEHDDSCRFSRAYFRKMLVLSFWHGYCLGNVWLIDKIEKLSGEIESCESTNIPYGSLVALLVARL